MTLEQYTATAIKFSEDTSSWYHLDEHRWYTTNGYDWEVSSDNASGGLPIDWAFHLTEEEIKEYAPENFFHTVREEFQAAIDNEYDLDQFQVLLNSIFG